MSPPTHIDLETKTLSLSALHAAHFRVVRGANEGDALSHAAELMLDDVYVLQPRTLPHLLTLRCRADGHFEDQSRHPPRPLYLDSILSFMSLTGPTTEIMLLVALDEDGYLCDILPCPLTPLKHQTEYQLMRIDRSTARHRIAQHGAANFLKGTQITLASGAQCTVEALRPGDLLLTRDDGVQPLRWVSSETLRATGPLAPVTLATGALNNTAALTVSAEHRLFIYQRDDHLAAGRAEVMVRARDLVNGTTVTQQPGGFAEYVQLAFDRPQLIFAQGICAETTRLDAQTSPVLPQNLQRIWQGSGTSMGLELTTAQLPATGTASKLRAAAMGR